MRGRVASNFNGSVWLYLARKEKDILMGTPQENTRRPDYFDGYLYASCVIGQQADVFARSQGTSTTQFPDWLFIGYHTSFGDCYDGYLYLDERLP